MGQQQHAHTPSKSLPPHTHIDTHTHNTHQPTTTPIIPPLITDITKMSNNNRSIAWRFPQLLMAILGLVCLTGLLAATPASSSPNTGGRVLLSDVQTLTLHNGRMTTGRRSSPVPQATSIGGTAQGQYTPYILAGSCGVEYTLELTQEGRDIQKAKASSSNNGGYGYTQGVNYNKNNYARGDSSSDGIGGVMFAMFIVLIIIVMACSGGAGNSHTTVHHTAPPAYSSSGYGHGGYGGYGSRRSTGSGFWPGFIGGSIAGSAFSSSRPSSYNSGYSSSRGN